MSTISDSLEFVKKEGLSFIPVPFKTKAATLKWEPYQKRKPTDEESAMWFGNGHSSNLAIVCGAVSGNLVVLDCDTEQKFFELVDIITDKIQTSDIFSWTPIVKTGKGYHIYLKTIAPLRSQKFPALDIKAEGGYVIGPGSIHPSGTEYKFVNEFPPNIRVIDSLKDIGIDIEQKTQEPTNQPGWVSELLRGVGQGGRNDAAAKLAGYFRNTQPPDVVETLLINWNLKNSPPLPDVELRQVIKSSERYQQRFLKQGGERGTLGGIGGDVPQVSHLDTNSHKNDTVNDTQNDTPMSTKIDEWIEDSHGLWFETQQLDNEMGIKTAQEKLNRRVHLGRLVDRKIIERHPKDVKRWRQITKDLVELDYKHLALTTPLDIELPLGLSLLTKIFPGNLFVIAGSQNAGKSAVALELIRLNNDKPMLCHYFYSEGGDAELRNRLDGCEGMDINEWNFRAFSRSTDFADVIVPGCLNVVDYLEVTDEFYSVADKLTAICNKNPDGFNVVCLQKNAGAKLGRGGSFSLEKARLYIAFDEADGANNAQAEIIKAKSWAVKGYNPNHLKTTFHIQNGWIENNAVDWTATGGDDFKLPQKGSYK